MKKILLIKTISSLCAVVFCQSNNPITKINYALPKATETNIINHSAYSFKYNEHHEQAEWVAYKITKSQLEIVKCERTNDFRIDPKVITKSATLADYVGSGFDRGHLAPAAIFKWSKIAMSESFYMSNISPQLPSFNRGIWKRLEYLIRCWALRYDELFVVTGPLLKPNILYKSIGENKITVPNFYFKAIIDKRNQKGIAFLIPNKKSNENLLVFALAIDELEKITNIDFFHQLNNKIEQKIESQSDWSNWKFNKKETK